MTNELELSIKDRLDTWNDFEEANQNISGPILFEAADLLTDLAGVPVIAFPIDEILHPDDRRGMTEQYVSELLKGLHASEIELTDLLTGKIKPRACFLTAKVHEDGVRAALYFYQILDRCPDKWKIRPLVRNLIRGPM